MRSIYWFIIIILVYAYIDNLTSRLPVIEDEIAFRTLQVLTDNTKHVLVIMGNASAMLVLSMCDLNAVVLFKST